MIDRTPHVVVIGGSVAGLGAGLALTDRGYRVTILEGDASPMPESHVEAFERWERRGSPQTRHSHALLARLRNLIRDHAPELLDKLRACGADELRFTDMLKQVDPDAPLEPGDDDIVLLACRRVTFEWVLRRHVLDTGLVDFRDGVTVRGLEAEPGAGGAPPHVTGVRLAGPDGVESRLDADFVVDASGRRSKLRRWLAEIGCEPIREESEPCGIFYTSRFYRLRDGVEPPAMDGPIVGEDLGYVKIGLFPGDARIFSITLAASPDDDDLRAVLQRPAFEAAARALPQIAAWVDPGVSEPISDVHAMANLKNTRRFLVEDGEPRVTGYAAIGDALIHTNPITGRGCSLAWVGAFELARALAEHADPRERVLAYDAAIEREVVPWYRMQVQQDRDAVEVSQAQRRGEDPFQVVRPDGTNDPKAFMRSVIREGLIPAIRSDVGILRRFMRLMNLLEPPEDLMRDPAFFGRVVACYNTRHEREPAQNGPRRTEMVDVLARTAA
jgi:2-polyprenyl-6-methoxyphenol hydroxylase-like FAD-dependent oxidoreductase